MSATLRLTRRHPAVELRRGPFEIELDGNSIGSITTTDEAFEIPIEAGHHTLRMGSGRFSSHERSFDVADGDLVNFLTHGPLFWPNYVASLVKPDSGITLKRE